MPKSVKAKSDDCSTAESIERAFMNLMSEMPLNEISVSRICQRANVSVGSFYFHFPSKDVLLMRRIERARENSTDYIRARLRGNAMQMLRTYLFCAYEYFIRYWNASPPLR